MLNYLLIQLTLSNICTSIVAIHSTLKNLSHFHHYRRIISDHEQLITNWDISKLKFTHTLYHEKLVNSQIGDEEQARRKAMTHAFPRALQVTCTHHMQNNGDKKLDSVVSKPSDIRHAIHNAIFGSNGLTSCNDVIAFGNQVKHIHKMSSLNVRHP